MQNQLFISDLDGTLLDSTATLSAFTRRSLCELLEEGMNFTVASARGLVGMRQVLGDFPFKIPVIGSNGAFISDFQSGRHLHVQTLADDLKAEVAAFLIRQEFDPVLSTHSPQGDFIHITGLRNQGMALFEADKLRHKDPRLRHTALREALQEPLVCFLVIDRYEPLAELEKALKENFGDRLEVHFYENVYEPGWYYFTVYDYRATKSAAIRILTETLGFSAAQLTVFGDNTNDISMFREAATSVAVANAHEALLPFATHRTDANTDDGVVRYLLRVAGKIPV